MLAEAIRQSMLDVQGVHVMRPCCNSAPQARPARPRTRTSTDCIGITARKSTLREISGLWRMAESIPAGLLGGDVRDVVERNDEDHDGNAHHIGNQNQLHVRNHPCEL